MEINTAKYENDKSMEEYIKKIDETREKLEENFKKIRESVEDDAKINQSILAEEVNANISKSHRYISRWSEERIIHNKLLKDLEKMEAELYHYYRFKWDFSTKLTEGAIAKYISGHPCYSALKRLVSSQKNLVDWYEKIVDMFIKRNYSLKNLIDLRKMELGIN